MTSNQQKAKPKPEIRGQAKTRGQPVIRGQEAEEVNYRIDYATIPGYGARGVAQWMITVAKLF